MTLKSKKIKCVLSFVAALICSLSLSLGCAAESQPIISEDNISSENNLRDALIPSGNYTSTSDPYSFITIDSGINTTCLVYLVYADATGKRICGTGYYDYNSITFKLDIYITKWYYEGSSAVQTETKHIPCTFDSDTNTITTGWGEQFVH